MDEKLQKGWTEICHQYTEADPRGQVGPKGHPP